MISVWLRKGERLIAGRERLTVRDDVSVDSATGRIPVWFKSGLAGFILAHEVSPAKG